VTCESACTKTEALNCPNDDPHEVCVNECEDDSNNYGEACKSKYSAILSCALDKGTLACAPDGTSDIEENVTTICRSEVEAFAMCGACYPATGDSPCIECAKQSCCDEFKAAIADPSYLDWVDCRSPCGTDTACNGACDTKYATVKTKLDSVTACAKNKCASVCGTGG